MAGSHVEEGGEQVRGKDSAPSTRGRKDKSRDAISSLERRFVGLELGVADTKEGMDLLEQSMEKSVEDLKVQIQDLQEGMQSSSIHAVSHEEFVTFQDRVLSVLASLESRVEVLTKHEEKLRQVVAIYKTALSARVIATHEAPRVEVQSHTRSVGSRMPWQSSNPRWITRKACLLMTRAQGLATAWVGEKRCPPGVQKMTTARMGEKSCPVVLPGMGRARCPTLGKIKASASNGSLRQS